MKNNINILNICFSPTGKCNEDRSVISICSILSCWNEAFINSKYDLECTNNECPDKSAVLAYSKKYFIKHMVNDHHWRLRGCYELDECGLGGIRGGEVPCVLSECTNGHPVGDDCHTDYTQCEGEQEQCTDNPPGDPDDKTVVVPPEDPGNGPDDPHIDVSDCSLISLNDVTNDPDDPDNNGPEFKVDPGCVPFEIVDMTSGRKRAPRAS